MSEVLIREKLKINEKVLVLCNELDTLKDLMNKREEVFNTDLLKIEEESRELTFKIELLVKENNRLLEKVQKPKLTLFRTGTGTVPQKHSG